MKWDSLREEHPDRWVVIEALLAHSDHTRRILDELALIATFDNSQAALQKYLSLHHESPEREIYVAHTSKDNLSIEERRWMGVRKAN